LDTAHKAAKRAGLSEKNIFVMSTASDTDSPPHTTVDELISQGRELPPTPPLEWIKGQGKRQVAYLCYSSGTSGLPKAVMLSHTNIISNVLAGRLAEAPTRDQLQISTQVALGLLPLSHIYGLSIVALISQYRGDEVVVLPKFEIDTFLQAVDRFNIRRLNMVPPILISMMQNEDKCRNHDLSSVQFLYSGAAPLGKEVVQDALKRYPQWRIGQGYGMGFLPTQPPRLGEDGRH
jgi:acyl-CoA synthetase (AMP-forming)/AMP-acid ligase II